MAIQAFCWSGLHVFTEIVQDTHVPMTTIGHVSGNMLNGKELWSNMIKRPRPARQPFEAMPLPVPRFRANDGSLAAKVPFTSHLDLLGKHFNASHLSSVCIARATEQMLKESMWILNFVLMYVHTNGAILKEVEIIFLHEARQSDHAFIFTACRHRLNPGLDFGPLLTRSSSVVKYLPLVLYGF